MHFYTGKRFDDYADGVKQNIENQVGRQDDEYILNTNAELYCDHLESVYAIDIPEIYFDRAEADVIEKEVQVSELSEYAFYRGDPHGRVRVSVVRYFVPYSGNIQLLELRPNPSVIMSYEGQLDHKTDSIIIEVPNVSSDTSRVQRVYQDHLSRLKSNYDNVISNCFTFNNCLRGFILQTINRRKDELLKRKKMMASLGVPIRIRKGVSQTFSVPRPKMKEKIVIEKPVVRESSFQPEPTLDRDTYFRILRLINDAGKNLERMPSLYHNKGEEDIRDYILFLLDPNFEMGSAGGETFNKTGKTDISLRYDSNVVFVAECKFWKGEAQFLKTIDQLLSYLTWRDSKVAVINFVQNKEFTQVLGKINTSIVKHPNYVKSLGEQDQSWHNYKFHLNGDPNRLLDLAVISYHLPN